MEPVSGETEKVDPVGRNVEVSINWKALDYYAPLRRVREHLERNITEPFTVSVAARIAGFNESYFSTYFRSKVGAKFTDWVHFVRVERAKRLMRGADHTISEVARLVGFGDLRTFERAFRKWTKTTPVEYKRKVRPSGSS